MKNLDSSSGSRARIFSIATGGSLIDRGAAEAKARLLFPPTRLSTPETFVLDLGDDTFEIIALRSLILPLAERIRQGFFGVVHLVIATRDEGATLLVDYLAAKYALPAFISRGTSPEDLVAARPAGNITATEMVTLEAILSARGEGITASALAEHFGIELNAAGNRLANLEKRGLVYRVRQPGREGDRFLDPRASWLAPTAGHAVENEPV